MQHCAGSKGPVYGFSHWHCQERIPSSSPTIQNPGCDQGKEVSSWYLCRNLMVLMKGSVLMWIHFPKITFTTHRNDLHLEQIQPSTGPIISANTRAQVQHYPDDIWTFSPAPKTSFLVIIKSQIAHICKATRNRKIIPLILTKTLRKVPFCRCKKESKNCFMKFFLKGEKISNFRFHLKMNEFLLSSQMF